LGGTNLRAALVDQSGTFFKTLLVPTDALKGAKSVLASLKSTIHQLIDTSKVQPIAIGMGSPGCIDSKTGKVLFATPNLPGWQGTNLKKVLQSEFHLPVYVDNDANMTAFGESRIGAGKGYANLVCLTLGTGVGGGIIINHHLYHGRESYAGEFGHMTIDSEGWKCNCGGIGCLEAYVGTTGIIKITNKLLKLNQDSILQGLVAGKPALTPQLIYRGASKGDLVSKEVFRFMGFHLGIGIANIINTLSPDAIIIGGGISNAWKYFYPAVKEGILAQGLFASQRTFNILRAKLGENAGLLGAAFFALEQEHKK
jgi:glucokinase